MIRRAFPTAVAVGIAFLSIVPARAEPVVTPVADVVDSPDVQRDGERFRHRASGYVFPSSLGEMPARKLTIFGPSDVAVQYSVNGRDQGDAWIDLYVYPAGEPTIEEAAADIVNAITRTFNASPALPPRGITVRATGVQSSWFDGRLAERSLKTGYYVVKRGDWLIKIRATMPSPPTQDFVRRTAAAISAVNIGPLPAQR